MCDQCTLCGSADTTQSFICIICHKAKVKLLVDTIEQLQRELRTVRTSFSFAQLALKHQQKRR